MGNDQGGMVFRHLGQGPADGLLGGAVQGGGRLVENQDARMLEDGPGNGHALLLAPGELEPPLPHHRVPALRQALDEVPDMGHGRRPLDLDPRCLRAPVGDVVIKAVVKEHRILGHDADGCPQTVLGHAAQILAIDQDAPARHVVEAKQEPGEGRFPRPAVPHHRHLLARADLETKVAQDGPLRLVMESDPLETDGAPPQDQGPGVGGVPDLRFPLQQLEHQVHVRQGILDLAIDDPEKIQRDEDLQQEGVDQHQVTDTHLARHHPPGGQPEDQGHAQGDDAALAEVQQGHGGLALDRHLLPGVEGAVITPRLQALVAEILDGLVIDQAIEGLAVGLGVQPVHLMAVIHAPLGHGEGKEGVEGHGAEGHQGKGQFVAGQQDGPHQAELHQDRQDAEGQVVEDGADRARPPFQIPADGSALALQVIAQGQPMQMLQHPGREPAHGPVTDPREDDVAQLVEEGGGQFEQAIGQQQTDGQYQGLGLARLEGIDDVLQHQRHPHVRHLRQHQAGEGQEGPTAELPQIGQHGPQIVGIAAVLMDPFGGIRDHGAPQLDSLGPLPGPRGG